MLIQEVSFPAAPARVFQLLTDAGKFASATGRPAAIGQGDGTGFSMFGGYIEGRHIELGPGLTLDHEAYPEGPSPMYPTWHEHLSVNWPIRYFEPFTKYLAG